LRALSKAPDPAGRALPTRDVYGPAPAPSGRRRKRFSILPGFGLTLGLTLTYLAAIVIIPLAALALRPWEIGAAGVWRTLSDPRVVAALRLSFGLAALAALVNVPLGLLVAWPLARFDFPGRRLLDAAVDLPFALPTAVAGIALTALYAPTGFLGGLAARMGLKAAYTPLGIFIALLFVGLPFVVRQVEPVLAAFDREVDEAARTLGASDIQRVARVILPALVPAILGGLSLAFARAVGEYGSVIFIAGNMPMKSEIAPLLIVTKLEEYDYAGAAAIGLAMVVVAFGALLAVNALQMRLARLGQA
jgi:sulfate transport system permease protein